MGKDNNNKPNPEDSTLSFAELPEEIISLIADNLDDPDDIFALAKTEKHTSTALGDRFWAHKLQQHFPKEYSVLLERQRWAKKIEEQYPGEFPKALESSLNPPFKKTFIKCYNNYYIELDDRQKKLFFYARENNTDKFIAEIEAIKKDDAEFNQENLIQLLTDTKDASGSTLLHIINKHNHRKLFDYFYTIQNTYEPGHDHQHFSVKRDILFKAPLEKLEELFTPDMISEIITDQFGTEYLASLIQDAIDSNNMDACKFLLKIAQQHNLRNVVTAEIVGQAIAQQDNDLFKLLLDQLNPSAINDTFEFIGSIETLDDDEPLIKIDDKVSLIHLAALYGTEAMIDDLISKGASLDKKSKQSFSMPIELAAMANNLMALQKLMTHKEAWGQEDDFIDYFNMQLSKHVSPDTFDSILSTNNNNLNQNFESFITQAHSNIDFLKAHIASYYANKLGVALPQDEYYFRVETAFETGNLEFCKLLFKHEPNVEQITISKILLIDPNASSADMEKLVSMVNEEILNRYISSMEKTNQSNDSTEQTTSTFFKSPDKQRLEAAKQLLSYMKGEIDFDSLRPFEDIIKNDQILSDITGSLHEVSQLKR